MTVANDTLMAGLGPEIGMLCQKLGDLHFDGLGQQRTRAAPQDLGKAIGKGPWLGELDDVTVGHGLSLLHWRSGGVEHHHDTPPYLVKPSPTSGHSSQISRIRLSDKTSRLCPRLAAPSRGQAYETVMPVEVRERIRPAPPSPGLVLVAQPPAEPHGCLVVEPPIRCSDAANS